LQALSASPFCPSGDPDGHWLDRAIYEALRQVQAPVVAGVLLMPVAEWSTAEK
jgi:hypothetical protein